MEISVVKDNWIVFEDSLNYEDEARDSGYFEGTVLIRQLACVFQKRWNMSNSRKSIEFYGCDTSLEFLLSLMSLVTQYEEDLVAEGFNNVSKVLNNFYRAYALSCRKSGDDNLNEE